MEKRRLGRTGQMDSVAIFGGAALSEVTQEAANDALDLMAARGVLCYPDWFTTQYSHTEAQIDHVIEAAAASVKELL